MATDVGLKRELDKFMGKRAFNYSWLLLLSRTYVPVSAGTVGKCCCLPAMLLGFKEAHDLPPVQRKQEVDLENLVF